MCPALCAPARSSAFPGRAGRTPGSDRKRRPRCGLSSNVRDRRRASRSGRDVRAPRRRPDRRVDAPCAPSSTGWSRSAISVEPPSKSWRNCWAVCGRVAQSSDSARAKKGTIGGESRSSAGPVHAAPATVVLLSSAIETHATGRTPTTASKAITASAHTSHVGAGCSPRTCSGDAYSGVPISALVRDVVPSVSTNVEMPKSRSLTVSGSPAPDTRKTFSGFRSRCTRFWPCAPGARNTRPRRPDEVGALERSVAQGLTQRPSLQELHHEERAAVRREPHVMNRDDVGVCQRGRGPRLAAAAFHGARGLDTIAQQLDRDDAVQLQVAGGIDSAHAAVAEPTLDGIPLRQHPRRVGRVSAVPSVRQRVVPDGYDAPHSSHSSIVAACGSDPLRFIAIADSRSRSSRPYGSSDRLTPSASRPCMRSPGPVTPTSSSVPLCRAFGARRRRQLVEYRARSVPPHHQRLSEHREQSNGFVIRPETHARMFRRRARDGLVRLGLPPT